MQGKVEKAVTQSEKKTDTRGNSEKKSKITGAAAQSSPKSEYGIMRNLAADYLKMILSMKHEESRHSSMAFFLIGIGPFTVNKSPHSDHNYHAVLDEIYKYKKENPTSNIAQLTDEAIKIKLIQYSLMAKKYLARAFGIYDYILKSEAKGNASFRLDVKDYLRRTREGFRDSEMLKEDPTLNEWFSEQEAYLENKYFR